MNKLKIAFVLDDTLDTPDGVQQYILTLGRWLDTQGHDVHYIVGRTERSDVPNVHSIGRNIRVRFNGNRMSTPLPASRKEIRKLLQHENFDIIHVQMPYSPLMAGRIVHAAPAATAIVGTFHIAPNSLIVGLANRLLSLLLERTLRRFDLVFSVSQAAADFAKQAYGLDSAVLPNVVDTAQFFQAKPLPSTGGRTIVYLGRLVPRKGCVDLLAAWRILADNGNLAGCRLIICGRGPLEKDLRQYVRNHDMESTVTFTGFVSDSDKARYLKTADLAVFPSTGGESFGIVLLEAMAAGNPIVLAANNPGYTTVMQPHSDLLFPISDPVSLADKLADYLSDAGKRRAAQAWQQSYIVQFDVAQVGRRLLGRYQEVLRRKQGVR